VTISWVPGSGQDAVEPTVDVFVSDGTRALHQTGARTRKLTLHGIDPPLTVTAVVRGLRDDDVSGPAARARSVGR
jgi:hypothetical protein